MDLQELANHEGLVISAVVGVGGVGVLFFRYAKTLVPREGDKIRPLDTPELRAIRPRLESLMHARRIEPVQDRDVS